MIDNPVTGTLPPIANATHAQIDIAKLRLWSRAGRALSICYVDEDGAATERTIWSFMVGCFLTKLPMLASGRTARCQSRPVRESCARLS